MRAIGPCPCELIEERCARGYSRQSPPAAGPVRCRRNDRRSMATPGIIAEIIATAAKVWAVPCMTRKALERA